MQQFPNYYMIILARFLSFISGSFATVLLAITLYEEDFQQGFEITPGRSAFFFVGVFGTIFAATNGYTKENLVLEPQKMMNEVVLDTHYYPVSWRNKAHLTEVRDAFSTFYELKVLLLAQELLSVLLAPIILYYSLPKSADRIIDFFAECTVVSPNLGHICSFAKFDLQKHGNVEVFDINQFGITADNSERNVTRDGKLERSFMNFKATYPEWDPGMQGSQFISKLIQRKYGNTQKGVPRLQDQEVQYLQTDGSILEYSAEHGYEVGRELIKLLDAVYDDIK